MNLLIAWIHHGARQFWVSRMFTAAVVLTLALGIGGTTAIFTLMDAVMLRSLPVSDPARPYRIGDGDDSTAVGRARSRRPRSRTRSRQRSPTWSNFRSRSWDCRR